jgi:hypothetical protein
MWLLSRSQTTARAYCGHSSRKAKITAPPNATCTRTTSGKDRFGTVGVLNKRFARNQYEGENFLSPPSNFEKLSVQQTRRLMKAATAALHVIIRYITCDHF